MVFMSVFYVSAVRQAAQVIGGTVTAIWALPLCCKPTAGLLTAVTKERVSALITLKILSASIVVTQS